MAYFESISTFGKKELIKEAKKNMKELDRMKIDYKTGANFEHIKERLHVDSLDLDKMDGDTLYLLNVQLDSYKTKAIISQPKATKVKKGVKKNGK